MEKETTTEKRAKAFVAKPCVLCGGKGRLMKLMINPEIDEDSGQLRRFELINAGYCESCGALVIFTDIP